MPRVKLILEYDLGNDWEDYPISPEPKDWKEYFEQADIYPSAMEIVGVKIEDE